MDYHFYHWELWTVVAVVVQHSFIHFWVLTYSTLSHLQCLFREMPPLRCSDSWIPSSNIIQAHPTPYHTAHYITCFMHWPIHSVLLFISYKPVEFSYYKLISKVFLSHTKKTKKLYFVMQNVSNLGCASTELICTYFRSEAKKSLVCQLTVEFLVFFSVYLVTRSVVPSFCH